VARVVVRVGEVRWRMLAEAIPVKGDRTVEREFLVDSASKTTLYIPLRSLASAMPFR